MEREIYLDNNATTRPRPEVRQEMLAVLGPEFGNPSSVHSAGDRGREHLERARDRVARLLGARPEQILFTGSGTEGNNTVLASAARMRPEKTRIVTTATEHSSILEMAEFLADGGVDFVPLPVDRGGRVDLDRLRVAITSDTALVSVHWVNNETGVIQPIEEIGRLGRERGVLVHTDAAQAVGKLPIDVSELPVDFLSLTAHKFHGPAGAGALYVQNPKALRPLLYGGPQEHGLRAGTENLSGIVGVGQAAELRAERLSVVQSHLETLRDRFEQLVGRRIPDVTINGDPDHRVCNTSNLCFAGLDGQALVARLDQAGIRCSQSSACTNRRPEPSSVLRAMGLSEEEAYASLRFSFSEENTLAEVEEAVEIMAGICEQLRRFQRLRRNPYQPQTAEAH